MKPYERVIGVALTSICRKSSNSVLISASFVYGFSLLAGNLCEQPTHAFIPSLPDIFPWNADDG